MAHVTFHSTEDSAATVKGSRRTVVVADTGCVTEVMERPVPSYRRIVNQHDDWDTVKEFSNYSAAIEFAKLYVDGKA